MFKGISRLGYKKEKFFVYMKIIQVEVPVKETFSNVCVEWKRGNKSRITSGSKSLTPQQQVVTFEETFSKHSIFYRDEKNNNTYQKFALFKVRGNNEEGKPKILGEINLNISSYVGNVQRELQVSLNRSLPGSTMLIEITISQESIEKI